MVLQYEQAAKGERRGGREYLKLHLLLTKVAGTTQLEQVFLLCGGLFACLFVCVLVFPLPENILQFLSWRETSHQD